MSRACITAHAPSRIDLAGGTLDIWPLSVIVPDALTLNLAIELRATTTIEARADDRVRVVSRDRRRSVTRRLPLGPSDAEGPLSLLLRQVRCFAPERGLTLTTRASAPAGAGLGGSSTLGLASGAALAAWTATRLGRDALVRRVMNLETQGLRVPTGNQDYLAAAHGGLAAYHHHVDGTRRERIALPRGLEQRLVLAYTGQPRNSGLSNWDMFRRFLDGESRSVRHMERIAAIAREMRDALRAGDLTATGRLLGEEGRLRARLAPTVMTPGLTRAARAARAAGAAGVKVCGAGGGGCLVAFAREGRAAAVAGALREAGARVLPVRVARQGVQVEGRPPRRP